MKRGRGMAGLAAALLTLVLLATLAVSSAPGDSGPDLGRVADEESSVVEVVLPDRDELDRLVETGVDLDHHVTYTGEEIVVHAVVTPNEVATLEDAGFAFGETIYTEDDAEARIAEREATRAAHRAENAALLDAPSELSAFDVGALVTDTVKILRADYYTTPTGHFLSVEAKTSDGQAQSFSMQVQRDCGPGTELGDCGTQNISRFVDAGVYMYHRGASSLGSNPRPDYIRVVSPNGGEAVAKVNDWLPLGDEWQEPPYYEKEFVSSYMTPTELYERIFQLHEQYPELTDLIELPHKTNGYSRPAMGVMSGTQAINAAANPSNAAVYLETHALAHEGGSDVRVEFRDPGAADSPLTVSVVGTNVVVDLATDSAGARTSTSAEVAAALNANPGASALLAAYTYAGNAGNGIVAPRAAVYLSDFLAAPDTVQRGPHSVWLLRIGKHRDGSKMGVFAYAQEHAREWVPPLVTVEAAERLLANYAHDGRTKQLLNNLDIFIAPSVNPDGGHYSFYDRSQQRRSMTRHCSIFTTSGMPSSRGSWGVDNNRNYDEYSRFDGYSGASASCTSDTYSGPAELSEPENKNVDWVPSTFDNIKFSMNLHSSGNYFMWSPGSYATPGRISAPRPSLADESFFWAASSRILTAIKTWRGSSVTPARTGPISDVLYSAAGNSGDMLFYKHGLYAWNFEVGSSFQPNWTTARNEYMEFANGLVELMRVAHDFDKDHQRPESTVSVAPGDSGDTRTVSFNITEPAAVYYTLDGSNPTYASSVLASSGNGIRETAESLTVPAGTTIHWFTVDVAGNVEKNYNPNGNGSNFNKATIG